MHAALFVWFVVQILRRGGCLGARWRGQEGTAALRCAFGVFRGSLYGLYRVANWARSAAVSRLMSGQQMEKISVPWTVPITWRQRAETPAAISRR